MENQNKFIQKEDFKRIPVLIFITFYLLAIILILVKEAYNALLIGLSFGIVFLCWLTIEITKKIQIIEYKIKKPALELAIGLLILLIFDSVPLPKLNFGDSWSMGSIVKKWIILIIIPFIFLVLRKNSLASMGLSLKNWKKNLGIGMIIFLALAIPSAFLVGDTGSLILKGKLSLTQFGTGFLVSFGYFFLIAGFPEEFFFRAFIQTRFSTVLKSKVSGILITSLIFGLIHIEDVMHQNPQMTIISAFIRVMFLQTFIGVIFGLLWERTRNLIPCVLVHSAVNGLNNIGWIISKLGLLN